ncbi:MAG TPA: hypothetical protein VGR02_13680 [Thermoanaerobaculia bacterium]|nr:hypothetical protein [Thermoanaerobaculia bacterium]
MIYRKRGRVVRHENGALLRIAEAGEAVERGVAFECRPLREEVTLPEIDAARLIETAQAIRQLPNIERVIISEGIAEHEYGDARWTDETRRMHVAVAAHRVRAVLDFASFDVAPVARVAEVLARGVREAAAPERIRLAPNVAASLLPSLIGLIEIEQVAEGVDGNGEPVEAIELTNGMQWPNWFRPSYRIRPLPMPFHLRARPFGAIDDAAPEAIGLVGARRVLLEDGSLVPIRLDRIHGVGKPDGWYPYGAGSFGAYVML